MAYDFTKNTANYLRWSGYNTFANNYAGANQLILSIWFRVRTADAGVNYNRIISTSIASGSTGMAAGVNSDGTVYVGFRSSTADSFEKHTSTRTVSIGGTGWNHLLVCTTFGNPGRIQLFLNGEWDSDRTAIPFASGVMVQTSQTTNFDYLGADAGTATPSSTLLQFDGQIAEMAVWGIRYQVTNLPSLLTRMAKRAWFNKVTPLNTWTGLSPYPYYPGILDPTVVGGMTGRQSATDPAAQIVRANVSNAYGHPPVQPGIHWRYRGRKSLILPVGGGTTDATITAAAGVATASTLAASSTAAAAITAAAGAATASTIAATSTAASTPTTAAGAATTSTLAASAVAAASFTAAAGVATTSTLSSASATSAAITPATGAATASTLAASATSVAAITQAAGVATASTLAASATAVAAITPATGVATASTIAASGVAAAAITQADGVATTSTLTGAGLTPGLAGINPAAGAATTSTMAATATAAAAITQADGVATESTLGATSVAAAAITPAAGAATASTMASGSTTIVAASMTPAAGAATASTFAASAVAASVCIAAAGAAAEQTMVASAMAVAAITAAAGLATCRTLVDANAVDTNSAWWTYTVAADDLTYSIPADSLTYAVGADQLAY